MAPTLPSLLWGWVNAKHAGGVPNCIRLARPLLLDCGPASGKSARTLASFERGISCTGRSSASLAGALLSRGGLCLLHGDLTTTILPAAPSLSLWTCQCLHGAALTHTWPSLRVSLVLPLWYSASPTWFPCLTLYIIALGMWRSFVLLRYWTESSRRKVVDSWAGQSSSPKRCPQRLYQLTANTLRES